MDKYITNARGAKIYEDISKHDTIELMEGNILSLHVLSIGNSLYEGQVHFYLTTQRDDGSLHVYVLPKQYEEWVIMVMEMARTVKLFPATVEFSLLNGKYGADIQ